MGNHWAVSIGINQYQHFQPLSYAQNDARSIQAYLVDEVKIPPFHCLLMTDTSLPVDDCPTYPEHRTIQTWLSRLEHTQFQPGDSLWFFFSGYGVCDQEQDYLVPIDGDPTAIPTTGISTLSLYEQFRLLPDINLLVILDINRSQGLLGGKMTGVQTVDLAHRFGIPTILSCGCEQFSHEVTDLRQGLFTVALLEGLRSRQCDSIVRLDEYLCDRLPQLSEQYGKPTQTPWTIAHPSPHLSPAILPQSPSDYCIPSTHHGDGVEPINTPVNVNRNPTGKDLQLSQNTFPVMAVDVSQTSDQFHEPPPPLVAARFWKKTILGGGALAITLLTGVLIRNPYLVQTGMNAAQSQVIWEQSQQLAQDSTTENIISAISLVSQIPTNLPLSPRVAEQIKSWDQSLVNLVRAQVEQRSFTKAIAIARTISTRRPTLRTAMQGFVEQSSIELLRQAESLASQGQLRGAIQLVSTIPPTATPWRTGQQYVDQWSHQILNLAEGLFAAKNIEKAIALASEIPSTTPAYGKSQQYVKKWKLVQAALKTLQPRPSQINRQ